MKKWWLILGGILMGIGILFGMHKQADAQYQFPQETDRHEGNLASMATFTYLWQKVCKRNRADLVKND